MVKIGYSMLNSFMQLEEYKNLTKLQKKFFKEFFSGRNIFLTGPAGTGKSYTVNLLFKYLDLNGIFYGKTATTGVAALNIGGVTLHSWSGMGIGEENGMDLLDKVSENKKAVNRIKNAKVLVIDEISMAKAELIEKLDIICQYIRNKEKPFGGIQTVFVGDFCLKNGTKIVMFDGSLREIENVGVGDLVMGPDSKPRTVIRKFEGSAPLFKIQQANAEDYVVTGNHQVVLKRRGNSGRYPGLDNTITITARDLKERSKKFLEVYGGYKAGCLHFQSKDVNIDPYFLGVWLGDGHSDSARITTMDPEIVTFCESYAKRMGLVCKISSEHGEGGTPTPAVRVSLTSGIKNGRRDRNPLLNLLKKENLYKNKHIPKHYLVNSEEVRLSLLAGLLDTDGCWSGNRFIYSSSIEHLALQVKQLSDHLGLRTNMRRNSADTGWDVTIGGDTWRIPTKIKRKKKQNSVAWSK